MKSPTQAPSVLVCQQFLRPLGRKHFLTMLMVGGEPREGIIPRSMCLHFYDVLLALAKQTTRNDAYK